MAVNPEATFALLGSTLSQDVVERQAAESALHALNLQPGFLTALFRVATSPPASPQEVALRLAAAVYLKNLIRREWQHTCPGENRTQHLHSYLDDANRDYVRREIVPTMGSVDPRVRAQLSEALKRIVSADFPARYSYLMDQLMDTLVSGHPGRVEGGLVALRALAKVYEFKGAALASRVGAEGDHVEHTNGSMNGSTCADFEYLHQNPSAALNYVVRIVFPVLLGIMRQLENTIDTRNCDSLSRLQFDKPFEVQRTICKIFWSFTQYDLPTFLVEDLNGVFSDWMNIFLRALRRPVVPLPTADGRPPGEEELRRMPQWKVKQWIGHIVYRLFQRYSNPSRLNPCLLRNFDEETLTRFGDFFRRTFAAPFTEVMLEILSWDQRLISPRVANLALLYLESAVSPGLTYKVMKPRLELLITNIIFPYLCISHSDLSLWGEDPLEYVRKTYDVLEDFNTPRAAACSLLSQLAKLRRSVVVSPLMGFLIRILEAYAAVRSATSGEALQQKQMLARQKEGALLAIGTIRESIVSHPQSTLELERLLSAHVVHEFESDIPFLRARACWLYAQLTAAESVSLEFILPGLEGVQKCLVDKEFPVRVRAAVDIRHFLQNKVAAERIAPSLKDLLSLLFTLLDDIDNTDIVATIDQVVVGFSDQVAPYAAPLCARLVETFSRAASAGQADDEAGFAAAQCIQALESIVTSVALSNIEDKIVVLADIERTIAEVFDHMFEEDRIEYFEEALELLATFVYHSSEERGTHLRACNAAGVATHPAFLGHINSPSARITDACLVDHMQADVEAGGGVISPYLWSLFPSAMYAFHDWASDYSFHYLHLVDAYLSKCPHVFVSNKDGVTSYTQLLLGMISRLWDDSSLDEDDFAIQGSRVCSLFLQHFRSVAAPLEAEVGVLTRLIVTRLQETVVGSRAASSLLRSFAHVIYISPLTSLTIIENGLNATTQIFAKWIQTIHKNHLPTRYDRKASAIALSAILSVDWNLLPPAVRQELPQLVLTIVSLLEGLAEGGDGEEGENGMFCLLCDVDELLYFESVVRKLPGSGRQMIGRELGGERGRVEGVLGRAELRRVPGVGVGVGGG